MGPTATVAIGVLDDDVSKMVDRCLTISELQRCVASSGCFGASDMEILDRAKASSVTGLREAVGRRDMYNTVFRQLSDSVALRGLILESQLEALSTLPDVLAYYVERQSVLEELISSICKNFMSPL